MRATLGRTNRSALPTSQLLRVDTLNGKDVDAWRRLADAAVEPNPFFRPEFVLPSLVGRTDDALLLVVPSADGWAACLPLQRSGRWRRQRFAVLAHWLPNYSYLATPLVAADALEAAAGAIADFISAEGHATAVVLDPVDPDGAVFGALRAALAARALGPRTYAEFQRAALRRRPEPTYLAEAASSHRRKGLRRQHRALARELGGELEIVDRSSDAAAYDDFLDIERESWKGATGTALANSSRDAAFFRRMCAGMAATGHLQLLEMRAAGRTVAMQVNLLDGGMLFGMKVAFNRDLARFSPGALLEVDAFQIFHDRLDLTAADSCAEPGNALLNALWPDRRRLETVLIPTGRLRAKLVDVALGAEAAARRVVRAQRRARGLLRDRRG